MSTLTYISWYDQRVYSRVCSIGTGSTDYGHQESVKLRDVAMKRMKRGKLV